MKTSLLMAAFLGMSVVATGAHAVKKGDPARGEQLAGSCAGCHGADGNSTNPQFPRLAGQYADYMVQSLKAYKSGDRKNAIMAGIVANLTEKDMQDLAAYFEQQKGDLYQKNLM